MREKEVVVVGNSVQTSTMLSAGEVPSRAFVTAREAQVLLLGKVRARQK